VYGLTPQRVSADLEAELFEKPKEFEEYLVH